MQMSKKEPIEIEKEIENETIENAPLTVGDTLLKARLRKKVEIDKISSLLCIRAIFLRALENGDYKAFPGQVYAFGFLKSYALYLNLDAEALLTKYRQETNFIEPKSVDIPVPEKQSLMPAFSYILVGLLFVLIVASVWYFTSYVNLPKEVVLPPIVEEEEVALPNPIMIMDAPVIDMGTAVVETSSLIKIVAKKDVWVEIQDGDTFILNRVLKSGETFEVPPENSETMKLKTDNAGAIDIFVGNQLVTALGPEGAVRSRISLAVDSLKNR